MLWVKYNLNDKWTRYFGVRGVDPALTVDEFIQRLVSDVNLDVHPSRVTLRLVPRGPCDDPDDPTEAQEQAATALRPRHTLRAAGVEDGRSPQPRTSAACTRSSRPGPGRR
jgi:hypothetical protein